MKATFDIKGLDVYLDALVQAGQSVEQAKGSV